MLFYLDVDSSKVKVFINKTLQQGNLLNDNRFFFLQKMLFILKYSKRNVSVNPFIKSIALLFIISS